MISFWDFVHLGRPQWRGQPSPLKAAFFRLLGTPDTHTRLRNSYVINQIGQLPLPPHSRVLDAGCGRAVALFWLAQRHPDWHLTGIELDPVLSQPLRRAVDRGGWSNMTVVEGNIHDLDAQQGYDLVISIDMMEHIEDDLGLLQQFWQALKPGGFLVLHVPRRRQEQWRLLPMFHRHDVDTHVRNEYTSDELRQVVEQAGFQVVTLRETIGRWGEVSFELNQLFWPWPTVRYLMAVLTYPIAVPLGYLDVRQDPSQGNSLLITATRDSSS
jgi:2-polyprenyl-3-methyl-5-hydroxy-6-metoxy-1,4-benzoquinol methylase